MPSSPYEVLEARFGGGLNLVDSPEVLADNAARVLQNWRFDGIGRLTTRKAVTTFGSALTGTICGIFPYTGQTGVGGIVLTYVSGGGGSVNCYSVTPAGAATLEGQLAGWTPASIPKVTAAVLNRVIFFADESKSLGLTYYDPNHVLTGSDFVQPTFNFVTGDADTPAAAAAKPRGVTEHANMLIMWGYGSEITGDGDRPEIVRFSFLGMADDQQGAGDGGYKDNNSTVTLSGSQNLFDREDAFMCGQRGIPVVSVASANGRCVIATADRAFVLFGTDRDSFQLDEIDNERGCLATRAMVEADGVVYWMSPLGPCRYSGGARVEDLALPVFPRIAEIDADALFAVHSPVEHQVRWHWNTNVLSYDYRHNQWVEDTLSFTPFCGGFVRSSGSESPNGAPTLTDPPPGITNVSVDPSWTNGDTSPGVTTTVQISTDSGFSTVLASSVVGSGITSTGFSALTGSTTYYLRAKHTRNGTDSSWSSTVSFATLSPSAVASPQNFAVSNNPVWNTPPKAPTLGVLATWNLGQTGALTEIHRSTTNGFTPSAGTVLTLTAANATSHLDTTVVASTTYYYKARHKDSDGNYSNYTSQVSITPNLTA